MLNHHHTGCRQHEDTGCGNVNQLKPIPTRTNNVCAGSAFKTDVWPQRQFEKRSRKVSQLFARFSFRSESNEKISLVRIRYSRIGQKRRSFPVLCESEVDAIL